MNSLAAGAVIKNGQRYIEPEQINHYFDHFEEELPSDLKQLLSIKKHLPAEIYAGSTSLHHTLRVKDAKPMDWVEMKLQTFRKRIGEGQKIERVSGQQIRRVYYEFRENVLPDYFDMMILDVLYSLYMFEQNRSRVEDECFSFKAKQILQVLAGDAEADIHKSPLIDRIRESLEKMQKTEIYIGKPRGKKVFLPMLPPMDEKTNGKKGRDYGLPNDYAVFSPLYRYLENQFHPLY